MSGNDLDRVPVADLGSPGELGPYRLVRDHRWECLSQVRVMVFDAMSGGRPVAEFVDELPCRCPERRSWRAEPRPPS